MFERLLDLLIACWERLSPAEIVDAYDGGVVLRFGIFHRKLAPGLHWKWPIVERIITEKTCVTTVRLAPQTLTTKDDVSVVVAAIVKYQITDLEKYVTKIWDQHDVLCDVAMGAIREAIASLAYSELVASPPEDAILKAARGEINQYGFKLHKITFTDLGRVRSFRLISRSPRRLDN